MYRQFLNAIALNVLHTLPQIPDFHLMVGSAEEHSSLPIIVYNNENLPKEVVKNLKTIDNTFTGEKVTEAIANNTLEVNDINGNIATLSQVIGGI